jgi:hypothetical protein
MIPKALIATFGFLCTAMVVIPTLVSLVVAFNMPDPGLGLLLAGCVFLVTTFAAGGALTLLSIADNTRDTLEVLRRMESNRAPQSRQAPIDTNTPTV